MPFEVGNSVGVQFSSENQPVSNGYPKGMKNRATIARKVLEMSAVLPDEMYNKLKEAFPEIEQKMTAEEIATLVILGGAIAKGDYNAYKAIMDSAYGMPKQDLDVDSKHIITIEIK